MNQSKKTDFKIYLYIVIAIFTLSCTTSVTPPPMPNANNYNFFIMSDMGETLGVPPDSTILAIRQVSQSVQPKFIISSGDFFHNDGVRDTLDPLWKKYLPKIFENQYTNVDIYAINGNHEYIGNPMATVEYSAVEPRWKMPALNYTFVKQIDSTTSVRFLMLDTSPFDAKYRTDPKYFKVNLQDANKTIAFADSVLSHSAQTWTIVVGHHPLRTSDFSQGNTPELIEKLDPLLQKYKVDFYFSGHTHKFEHYQRRCINYITTANGGSKSRFANPWFNTIFVKKMYGFTVCSVSHNHFGIWFVGNNGKSVYWFEKEKS